MELRNICTESLHGAGSPQARRVMIQRQSSLGDKKKWPAISRALNQVKSGIYILSSVPAAFLAQLFDDRIGQDKQFGFINLGYPGQREIFIFRPYFNMLGPFI